jgi:hypothetical protein
VADYLGGGMVDEDAAAGRFPGHSAGEAHSRWQKCFINVLGRSDERI